MEKKPISTIIRLFSFLFLIDDFFMFRDYLFYSFNKVVLEPIIYRSYAITLIHFIHKYG